MNRRFQFKEGIKNQGAICVMRVFDLQKKQDCLAKAIDKRASHILYRQASREMSLLQSIRSDGFPMLEYAEENEDQLIYYETWIDGISLEKWLKTKPSRRKKKNIFAQICDRVAAVHDQGFLYMDLKPEHILIDESQKVWLIDFNAVIPIGSEQAVLSNDLALPPENGIQNLDIQADLPGIGSLHRMMFGPGSISWSCLQENPVKRFRSIQDLKKAAFISPALCGFLTFFLISGCFLAAKIPGVSANEYSSMPEVDFSEKGSDPASFSVSFEQELIALIEKQEDSSELSDHEILSLMESVLTAAENNPLIVRLFLARIEVPEDLKETS